MALTLETLLGPLAVTVLLSILGLRRVEIGVMAGLAWLWLGMTFLIEVDAGWFLVACMVAMYYILEGIRRLVPEKL